MKSSYFDTGFALAIFNIYHLEAHSMQEIEHHNSFAACLRRVLKFKARQQHWVSGSEDPTNINNQGFKPDDF